MMNLIQKRKCLDVMCDATTGHRMRAVRVAPPPENILSTNHQQTDKKRAME